MKWNYKRLYILAMLLLLIWLLISNSIIVSISGAQKGDEIRFDSRSPLNPVNYTLDVEVMDEFTEVIYINGWAFVESEHDSSNRYVSFILKNENNTYEFIEDAPTRRPDVLDYFKDKIVPSVDTGIQTDLSLLSVKNGVYDFYIYCWENEHNFGLQDTGYQVVKNVGSLEYRPWQAKEISKKIQVTQDVQNTSTVDALTMSGQRIEVSGWAFLESQSCDGQNVYLQFQNEDGTLLQFETKSITRNDVAEVYMSQLYCQSGYKTSIPVESLMDGTWTMTILVKNNDMVCTSIPYIVTKVNGSVTISN